MRTQMLINSIFHVIGPGCGGTSLVAGLLDFNPLIEVGFELGAMQYLYRQQRRRPVLDYWRFRMHHYRRSVNLIASSSSKPVFSNKITTEQLAGLLIHGESFYSTRNQRRLCTIVNHLFQGQRLVLVMRDGRTCIPSKMSRGGHSLEQSVFRWQQSVQIVHHLHASPLPTYLLLYEDLVQNPDLSLRCLCEFIGVPFDAEMINGTVNSKMHPRYRSNSLAFPKAPLELPQSVVSAISSDLSLFGYHVLPQ